MKNDNLLLIALLGFIGYVMYSRVQTSAAQVAATADLLTLPDGTVVNMSTQNNITGEPL